MTVDQPALAIRPFEERDIAATAAIFHAAVRQGTAAFYSEEQRRAWSPEPPAPAAWRARLSSQLCWVATRGGEPVGFMTLQLEAPPGASGSGLIDLAFVAPDCTGGGVGNALYEILEAAARQAGLARLRTEASLVAEPFFARRGFELLKRNLVERDGVALSNATMVKTFQPAASG